MVASIKEEVRRHVPKPLDVQETPAIPGGIESGISWLKRCFGLWRCMWKSFRSFKSYVWASIVSANLFTLARGPNVVTD